jgi:ABC-type glycerol-3-phosphate transport system substrate-binding protein
VNTAALKGLIVPLDGLLDRPTGPSWYDYALAAARMDGGFYGLPFASQALVLAYQTDLFVAPPFSWSDLLASPGPFVFPGGDPEATFTLAQYLALGGPLTDAAGRPGLDPTILAQVLAFYGSARSSNVLPLSARQYTTATQTWGLLRGGRAASALATLSSFLAEGDPKTLSAIPLPTRDGAGTVLTRAWSWSIVGRDPSRQALAGELIAWLIDPTFLGPWTHALGLLPSTTEALSQWPDGADLAVASRLVTVARPAPPAEVLAAFGPPLQEAVVSVLSGEATPEKAALAAAQAIHSP